MHRLAFLTATAGIVLSGFGSADAATRHKAKHHAQPPAARQAPVIPRDVSTNRPRWASPQQCFTDDGYGRFTPCEGGGKGY
jgi:hypothetical protein